VLLDNFSAVYDTMRKIGTGQEMARGYYRDWPLFKEMRKLDEFARTFEEIYGEPLNTISQEAKMAQLPADHAIN